MPGRRVAGGYSAFPEVVKDIVLHAIPLHNDDRPEAGKCRKRWIDFVKEQTRNHYAEGQKMTSCVASPLPTSE